MRSSSTHQHHLRPITVATAAELTQDFQAAVADPVPSIQAPVDTVEEQAEHFQEGRCRRKSMLGIKTTRQIRKHQTPRKGEKRAAKREQMENHKKGMNKKKEWGQICTLGIY